MISCFSPLCRGPSPPCQTLAHPRQEHGGLRRQPLRAAPRGSVPRQAAATRTPPRQGRPRPSRGPRGSHRTQVPSPSSPRARPHRCQEWLAFSRSRGVKMSGGQRLQMIQSPKAAAGRSLRRARCLIRTRNPPRLRSASEARRELYVLPLRYTNSAIRQILRRRRRRHAALRRRSFSLARTPRRNDVRREETT